MLPATFFPPRWRLLAAAILLSAAFAPLLLPISAHAQRPNASTMHWVGTWGASPSSAVNNALVATHAYNGNNQYNNQTVRLIVHTSIGGNAVRIRLSNVFGSQAISIGAAHIGVRDGQTANIVAGTDRVLTFGRQTSITIPNNADTLSDPVVLPVPALGDLAVSLYLPATPTAVMTVHELANQTNYVSPANGGDHSGDTTFVTDPAAPTTDEWPLLSGVEVYVPSTTAAVATFGDSITDGFHSTPDTNHRWPDVLAQRLLANNQPVGVLNQGISGDRVLNDQIGPNGEARFERDVQIAGNAKFVTVLLGINDIGDGSTLTSPPAQAPTADQIIAGLRQFVARAHALNLKIYGCTVTPYGKYFAYSAAGEAIRQAINAFIRTPGNYDGVIDFDGVMKDPANPANMNPLYDSGDGLHPNDAGYQAMGNAVPLSLFQ